MVANSHKVNTFYQREVDFLDSINFIEVRWIDLIPEQVYEGLLFKITPFYAIRVQRRISASFRFKLFLIYLPKFTSKENSAWRLYRLFLFQSRVNRRRP